MIKITIDDNGQQAVSARELHEFMEVKEKFSDWMKRMIGYGFRKNLDYCSFSGKSEKPQVGRPTIDYVMTIDMAKEVSMIQRSDKGREARQYFIACEKQLKQQKPQWINSAHFPLLRSN